MPSLFDLSSDIPLGDPSGPAPIVSLNGQPIAGIDDLHRLLISSSIGVTSTLVVIRGTERREIAIEPTERT